MNSKNVVLSVTNDLSTDQRLQKMASFFAEHQWSPILVGRSLNNSLAPPQQFKNKRFNLFVNKGPLFYASYNLRLFIYLLSHKVDLIFSNDLDTLPACYYAALLKNKPLVFDSHEYFTEVPELVNRKSVQRIWKSIEKSIVPKLKNCITVSPSIAQLFFEEYGAQFKIIRNVPILSTISSSENKDIYKRFNIPSDHKIVIYQGALNMGRGIELAIDACKNLKHISLLIMGAGDIEDSLKAMVAKWQINNVKFGGRVFPNELAQITQQVHLGLSIEEDLGLNYRYALPNKLFDYIHAEIPVIVSNLPDMSSLVLSHKVGKVLKNRTPKALAELIHETLNDVEELALLKSNAQEAKQKLNWEVETKKLSQMLELIVPSQHKSTHLHG